MGGMRLVMVPLLEESGAGQDSGYDVEGQGAAMIWLRRLTVRISM